MSLSRERHHNIYGRSLSESSARSGADRVSYHACERGYVLVALLAVMTVLVLFALAAAPSIRQQAQREREKEAIFRGEEVAESIRQFYAYRANTQGGGGLQVLPTSVDQLLEGVPVAGGTKRRQILRASAARDPLSSSGEWRLVRPRSRELIEFERAVMLYSGNFLPLPKDGQMAQLQGLAVPQLTTILNTGLTDTTPGGEGVAEESSGPFVGVASRSKSSSVINYYGIGRHDQWIFTPLFR